MSSTVSIKIDSKFNQFYNSILFFGIKFTDKFNLANIDPCMSDMWDEGEKCPDINLSLGLGEHVLDYNGNIINLDYKQLGEPLAVEGVPQVYKTITISSESITILEEFMKASLDYYMRVICTPIKKKTEIKIFIYDGMWETLKKRVKRKTGTMYFDNDIHIKLLEEIKVFLSKEEETEYAEYGIPYKKNIILEGLPGTGKTSLVHTIASELDMNIAIISFDDEMTDKVFFKALKHLPKNTILLLEDIDVLFKERKANDTLKSAITFSGLINNLDGMGHVHKQIIFMTTNYICNLDSAIRRAGRVDTIIKFGYASKGQIKIMYDKFIKNREYDFNNFYSLIKHKKMTSAILQKYFFENHYENDLTKNIESLEQTIDSNRTELSLYS